jgi:asparagine synthase (glutamine-hydrolysing)
VQWLGAQPGFGALTPVQKAQWLEFRTLLPGYLLSTQGDRMALAHGVENRCPYLDPAVVAVAAATNLRFDDGFDEKRLLKRAFGDRLPPAVLAKGKFPYRAPDVAAFAERRGDTLDLLCDATLARVDCLDPVFARALVKKVFSTPPGQVSTRESQTFVFLMSLVWLHRYFVRREGLPDPEERATERTLVRVVDERTGAVRRRMARRPAEAGAP